MGQHLTGPEIAAPAAAGMLTDEQIRVAGGYFSPESTDTAFGVARHRACGSTYGLISVTVCADGAAIGRTLYACTGPLRRSDVLHDGGAFFPPGDRRWAPVLDALLSLDASSLGGWARTQNWDHLATISIGPVSAVALRVAQAQLSPQQRILRSIPHGGR